MERDDFDEMAPGEIVPMTTPKGTYSAFRPDPLSPSISTEQLITPLAEATQALGRLHGIGPRVGSLDRHFRWFCLDKLCGHRGVPGGYFGVS